MELYFTDVFGVSEKTLADCGAFNISLVTDLPLFVDPFLLFNSPKHYCPAKSPLRVRPIT